MATIRRTIAVSALAVATAGATAGAAQAHGGSGGGQGHGHGHHDRGISLTRSAAATLDKFDVDVDRARRGIAFDGDATTTWSKIRVNDKTNRVTAVVNGGDRVAVLKFKDKTGTTRSARHASGHGHHRSVLRLTDAGADSLDKAAGANAFDAGDAFAKKAGRC